MAVRLAAMGMAIVLLCGPSASAVGTSEQVYFIGGLLLVSMVSGPFAANADPDGGYDRSGPYLGAGATLAFNTLQSEVRDVLGTGTDVTDGFGGYMNVGYRLHPRIAAEAEFEWLGTFETSADVTVEIPGELDETTNVTFTKTQTWLASGNVKGFLFTGSIQPYGLLGVGAMTAKTEDELGLGLSDKSTDLVFRFGMGVDFYLSERFVTNVNIDYALPTNTLKDLDFVVLGIGLQYRF